MSYLVILIEHEQRELWGRTLPSNPLANKHRTHTACSKEEEMERHKEEKMQ